MFFISLLVGLASAGSPACVDAATPKASVSVDGAGPVLQIEVAGEGLQPDALALILSVGDEKLRWNGADLMPVSGRDQLPLPDGWVRRTLPVSAPLSTLHIEKKVATRVCVRATLAPEPTSAVADRAGWYAFAPQRVALPAVADTDRWWGVDLTIDQLSDAPDAQADAIIALGFNLVRFTELERPAPAGLLNPKRKKPEDPWLDAAGAEKLDKLVAALTARGVKLWLESRSERDEAALWEPDRAQRATAWLTALWGRTNPHTGRRYADDPAVVGLTLSESGSLLLSRGVGLEGLPAERLATLDRRWNTWLHERYPDDAALVAAWGRLGPDDRPGALRREPAFPALDDDWPAARKRDLLSFYAELEQSFYKRLYDTARTIGFTAPILPAPSNGRGMVQALQGGFEAAGAHFAFDKPQDGRMRGDSALAHPEALAGLLPIAVQGQAMVLTGLAHPAPNPYRAEAPLLWATLAGAQGWQTVSWSWRDLSPVLQAQMPVAAALFRGGLVPAADGFLPLYIDPTAAWSRNESRPVALREASTWLHQRVRTVLGGAVPATAPGAPVAGVTWADGLLLLETPTLRARVGPPGPLQPEGLRVSLDAFAAVSLYQADDFALLTIATTDGRVGERYAQGGLLLREPGVGEPLLAPAHGTVAFAWPRKPVVEVLDGAGQPTSKLKAKKVDGLWEIRIDGVESPWLKVH